MSAIWGIIDLNGVGLAQEDAGRMEEVYRSKKIDRVDTFFQLHAYMGCGVQFVTKEAREECFPYRVRDSIYFVADALLDNRDEVQASFRMSLESSRNGVDGSMMFEALNQDMDRALEEMLGAYAFAYYDKDRSVLQLASDAVGNRSVYYCYQDGKVLFSTLLEGITALLEERKANKQWFDNYFGQDTLKVVAEARETPYMGIYRVEPGEVVTFTAEGFQRRAYWDPFKNRKILEYDSDEAYKELVCTTFRKCVESVVREGSETAILLSGGLDSNAVAAYAAPKLRAQGRKLYSFTSVPDKEAKRIPANSYYVEDETEYIEELQKWHDNLVPEYIDASEGDILEENRKILDILEIPFKTVLNMPWIYKAYKQAAKKGCGIMLSGQYGNITISYGDFGCLFATLWRQGRWIRLWKEINAYSTRYRKSRKWILKELLKTTKEDTFASFSGYMYDKVALRQVGETEVKFSLDTGIIPRDPTRDKRLIALVLSLPLEQFVKMGQERRLVRQYMREIIPEKIVCDEFHRGRQGVGSGRLMTRQWKEISEALRKAFALPHAAEYFGVEGARKLMQDVETQNPQLEGETDREFERMKLMYSGLTCEYLERKYGM